MLQFHPFRRKKLSAPPLAKNPIPGMSNEHHLSQKLPFGEHPYSTLRRRMKRGLMSRGNEMINKNLKKDIGYYALYFKTVKLLISLKDSLLFVRQNPNGTK